MPADSMLIALIRRDRQIVLTSLLVVTLAAWTYVFWFASQMNTSADMNADMAMGISGMMMTPQIVPWTFTHVFFIFTMWTVMMVGMMTPSVAPMILIYTQVARQAGTQGQVFAPASYFASGYLLSWT